MDNKELQGVLFLHDKQTDKSPDFKKGVAKSAVLTTM